MSALTERLQGRRRARLELLRAARARHKARPTKASRALLDLRKQQVAEIERSIARHTGVDPVALRFVCPHLTPERAREIAAGLTKAFDAFQMNTPMVAAGAVAQMAHESDGFRVSSEYASGAAYEGRMDLGNTRKGDGKKFKGRGRIMITGRANYTSVSKALGIDCVENPGFLAQSPWSEVASAWWWDKNGCTPLAKKGYRGFTALTRRINGGTTGLSDRLRYYRRARKVKDLLARA